MSNVWRRTLNAISAAMITRIDDSGSVQRAQLRLNQMELRDNTPVLLHYGLASVPHPGADAAVLFVAGNRSGGVVIAVNDQRYRLQGLADGEVALYDDLGHKVLLSRTGIVIDGAGQDITIQNAPTIVANVDLLKVRGDIIDNYPTNPLTAAAFRTDIYDPHVHPEHDGPNTLIPSPQA